MAALLLFILLLVVGATTLLVSKLNKAATQYYRDDVTMKALLKAKESLIGFAATYPDNQAFSDTNAGPGFLPCPDTDGNGSPNPPCGSAGSGTYAVGRFPWEYIGTDEIRDSSGEQLWYSLSNNFRNNPKTFPLNSETPGQLSLDGNSDIVAVIIAPGTPVCNQDRPAGSNNVANYLEDVNTNGTGTFVNGGSTAGCSDFITFNDIVVAVTRDELMKPVEKRVLGEVANVLNTYQNDMDLLTPTPNDGSFPWLSPFSNPRLSTTTFDGNPSTQEGLLPIHLQDEQFSTSFTVSWNLPASSGATVNPAGTITATELESGTQTVTSGICRWQEDVDPPPTPTINGANTIECKGSVSTGGKTYTFDFGFTEDISFNGTLLNLSQPTSGSIRTREVLVNGSLPVQSISTPVIKISDGISTGTVSIENPSSGSIQISGINYDLNVSPGQEEIPRWFIANNWHHLIYISEASDYAPGGSGTCTAGSCLTIKGVSPNNTTGVIAIAAGKELPGQNRTSGTLVSYLENENNSVLDNIFMKNTYPPDAGYDPNFNDQVRIVAP